MNSNNLAFDAKSSVRHIDANGYLHVEQSHITKEQVVPYWGREIPDYEELGLEPDKIYQMYRPAAEIEKAVKTFNGVPLAFEHHMMSADSLPKQFIVGTLGTDAEFNAPYLDNSLIVTDKEAIDAIERGEFKELSAAYRYDPVMRSGTFEGKHYDGIMTNIKANHVALVREGRAGSDVVVADAKTVPEKAAHSVANKSKGACITMRNKMVQVARRALAFDAAPDLDCGKVNAVGLMNAINAVEAQKAGVDPRKLGLDIDKEASVEDVVKRFLRDEGQAEKLIDVLKIVKGENAHDPEAIDEDNDEMKAAMEDCGIDADSEEEKKAFMQGMKYAESLKNDNDAEDEDDENEPNKKKLGSDGEVVEGDEEEPAAGHEETENMDDEMPAEDEGEEAPDDEEKSAPVFDAKSINAKLRKAKEEGKKETLAHVRDLQNAAMDCKPLIGELANPFAFDSASDIYKKTLELNGINTKKFPRSAYRGMVEVLKSKRADALANDAAFSGFKSGNKEVEKALAGLDRIEIL